MIVDSAGAAAPIEGGRSATDEAKLQDDLNRFLTLLVTQLQHQDPLDPMDANQFTQQLVQFANVEQQIYQNANLEKLVAVEQSNQAAAMVSYIGRLAEVSGNALPLEGSHAEATYTLAENAQKTTIAVKDAAGRVVFSAEGATEAGRHGFVWDGRDSSGSTVPDGAYRLEVLAQGVDDAPVEVAQTVFGRVTGAAAEDGNVQLFLGDIPVGMDDVVSVREAPRPVEDE